MVGGGEKNKKLVFSLIYIINYHRNPYKHFSSGPNMILGFLIKKNNGQKKNEKGNSHEIKKSMLKLKM